MLGDAGQHISRPGFRVCVIHLCVVISVVMTAARSVGAAFGAGEQPRLRSAALFVRQIRPSLMNRVNRSQRRSI
jgi:hypothetical protein